MSRAVTDGQRNVCVSLASAQRKAQTQAADGQSPPGGKRRRQPQQGRLATRHKKEENVWK